MEHIRIMSHNLWRCDNNKPAWEEKGEDCSAKARAAGMVRVYTETAPDVIGCQEMSPTMADEILCKLEEKGLRYALLWGKDTPILYKRDRFELIDSDFLIYPRTVPDFEGEFNNSNTKSLCIAVLRNKEDGKKIIFMTTHLWWKKSDPSHKNYQLGSDEARVYQLNLAMDRLEEFYAKHKCPIVFVGDLNAEYHAPVIESALRRGFEHAHEIATEFADNDWGYHSCSARGYEPYTPAPFEKALDHIFIKYAPQGFVRSFRRYSPDYYLPLSDHSPVLIDAEL